MNIDSLAGQLASRADMTKGRAKTVIQIVFEELAKAAAAGETIHIADFGKFTVRDRPERSGRNQKTGEAVMIAASKKVSFKAAVGFKNKL